MIQTAHHVQISIPIGAEDEAREFYCGVLGMREIAKPDSLAGRGGFWLGLEEFQIHFGAEDDIDRAKTRTHVAYLVSNLEEWRGKLMASGCGITDGITDGIAIPNYQRFEFRDPFGNRIEFMERDA